jgi:type IV pilus assembly protein PilB
MQNISHIEIEQKTLALIPRGEARRFQAIPLRVDGSTLHVALPDKPDRSTISSLEFLTGLRISPVGYPRESIREALKCFYGFRQNELDPDVPDPHDLPVEPPVAENEPPSRGTGPDESVVDLVNAAISDAIRMGASDIHVEPYERMLRVRYRLDGMLQERPRIPIGKAKAVISRLKIMADLDIAEKRRPQDGRIRVKESGRTIDIRVSSLPTDFGEKIVLRILDRGQVELDLTKLGFASADLARFEKAIRLPYGMLLVTGPTGSGKTTTLYAALKRINRPELNITTIEDPIEYNLEGINQTHVRAEIDLTFAAALRSILRQDPNVIMVGEIRDTETARIAIRAALTGHLVFSTLHTNDAPSALTRLVDMGVEPFLVASSVRMILAQRLLRKICPECSQRISASAEQLSELGIETAPKSASFRRGEGCSLCGQTGYRGRSAIYEVLTVNSGISELIARNAPIAEIRKAASESGMKCLREAALEMALNGQTTVEEVLRETI